MPEQVAVVDACAAAEAPHRVAQLRVDERVDHHRRVAPRAPHRSLEVLHRLGAGVADLLELLFRKLGLERLDEARGGLAGGVGDDVELDRRRHASEASGWKPPRLQGPLQKGLTPI